MPVTFSYWAKVPCTVHLWHKYCHIVSSLLGLCISMFTSSAFWLWSPCIRNTNPVNSLPPTKHVPRPLPPPRLRAQHSASLFPPTTTTKWTKKPFFIFSCRAPSQEVFSQRQVNIPKGHSANSKWENIIYLWDNTELVKKTLIKTWWITWTYGTGETVSVIL